jgi:diguanylate cyclase (GGDEF)-like protein/PAS domain S-box-containing protein
MRLEVRLYALTVIGVAAALAAVDMATISSWDHTQGLLASLVLLGLYVVAVHFQFKVHSGWTTDASTVPAVATALILPPGLGMLISGVGLLTYAVSRRRLGLKGLFNTASAMLAVWAAAHLSDLFGGPTEITSGGWGALPAAVLASVTYYLVSATTVARVVSLDQRRSLWAVLRGKIGVKALVESTLGLVGSILAVVLNAAPALVPALVLPGALVYLAKQTMDRGERRSRNLALMSRVGRAVAGTLRPEIAFQAIAAREVRDTLKLDGIALVPLGPNAAFGAHVAGDVDEPRLREDLARRISVDGTRIVERGSSVRPSAAALPFGFQDSRRPTGALLAWRRGGRTEQESAFTSEELLVLETLADYAAVALETSRMANEMARLSRDAAQVEGQRRAELLQREALRQSEERFRSLVQNASDVIAILDSDGRITYASPAVRSVWGAIPEQLRGTRLLDLVHPDEQTAAATYLASVLAQPGNTLVAELRLHHSHGSWRDFEVVATNMLEQAAVEGVVATCRDITQRKSFERELSRLAFTDTLTALPNRALLLDRLTHALARADRQMRKVAVLFLDLDRFKVVNDSLGHASGDGLLVEVANRIRSCLRSGDTAARLGGDEFTVLLEDVLDESQALEVAERIAEALRVPVLLDGREVFISASIGIALSSPTIGADQVLRNADLALYRAKADGRSCYALFDPSMEARALERLELETDLRRALDRNELRVYFQPVVNLESELVTELEALVRWDRPGFGIVAPTCFIPIAEETGLIVPIGQWVLEEACRWVARWQAYSADEQPLVVSVNLSARQFQHPDLLADIKRTLRETGVDPRQLKLEITESVVMQDARATIETLQAFKALGIRVAIDDFGTGYSSLSYLKRLPVDTLKIDRSFVNGLGNDAQDTAIVDSVIALARTLQLSVTGEGVETSAQARHLKNVGCDRGQGFLFACPLPPEDVDRLLREARFPTSDLAAA